MVNKYAIMFLVLGLLLIMSLLFPFKPTGYFIVSPGGSWCPPSGSDTIYINNYTIFNCTAPININKTTNGPVIDINASNVVLDCNNTLLYGNSSLGTYGILNYENTNVTIRNCNIMNYRFGIDMEYADNVSLINNTLHNNSLYGLYVYTVTNTSIVNTTVTSSQEGIYFEASSNINVSSSNISNNSNNGISFVNYGGTGSTDISVRDSHIQNNINNGIYFDTDSYPNAIINNTIIGNKIGIKDDSYYNNAALYNIIAGNINGTENLKVVFSNIIANNSDTGIIESYTGNVNLSSNILYNNSRYGILSMSTKNLSIINNSISTAQRGIYSYYFSTGSNITSNIIFSTISDGIVLEDNSEDNSLTNNILYNINSDAIELYKSNLNNITNNTIYNSSSGLRILVTNNSRLVNNTIYNSSMGIYGESNINTTVTGNRIYNSSIGIIISSSPNSTIDSNNLTDNEESIFIGSFEDNIIDFYQNISETNLIDGKPIYYKVLCTNVVIDNSTNAGFVGLISCNNAHVTGLTLRKNSDAILIVNSTNSIIENTTFYYNSRAINIEFGRNVTVSNNTFFNNSKSLYTYNVPTIDVYYSNNTSIIGNRDRFSSTSITLESAYDSNITDNEIMNNSYSGVYLLDANKNMVINNTIYTNRSIVIASSKNNTISDNKISNFIFFASTPEDYYNNITTTNLINGRPVFYYTPWYTGMTCKDMEISNILNVGYIGLVGCTNITIRNLTISGNSDGLLLYNITNITIANSSFTNNIYGINIENTNGVNITNTTVTGNSIGVRYYITSNSLISDNRFSGNTYNDIWFYYASNNTIRNTALNKIQLEPTTSNNTFRNITLYSQNTSIDFIYSGGIALDGAITLSSDKFSTYKSINRYMKMTNMTPQTWVLINISYNDTDTTNENDIIFARWNDTAWVSNTSTFGTNASLNTTTNTYTINITRFSDFGLFSLLDFSFSETAVQTLSYSTSEALTASLSVYATIASTPKITIFDNDNIIKTETLSLTPGINSISMPLGFLGSGAHTLKFVIDYDNEYGETNENNNELIKSIYVYLPLPGSSNSYGNLTNLTNNTNLTNMSRVDNLSIEINETQQLINNARAANLDVSEAELAMEETIKAFRAGNLARAREMLNKTKEIITNILRLAAGACGNNICEKNEDYISCPSDCPTPFPLMIFYYSVPLAAIVAIIFALFAAKRWWYKIKIRRALKRKLKKKMNWK